jgi:hypothetical protein
MLRAASCRRRTGRTPRRRLPSRQDRPLVCLELLQEEVEVGVLIKHREETIPEKRRQWVAGANGSRRRAAARVVA